MKFTLDSKVATMVPPYCVACGAHTDGGASPLTVRDTRGKLSLSLIFLICADCAAAEAHKRENDAPPTLGCLVHLVVFAAAVALLWKTSASTSFNDYSLGNYAATGLAVAALVLPPLVLGRVFKRKAVTPLSDGELRRLKLLERPATLKLKANGFELKSIDLTFTDPTFSLAFMAANPLARLQ